MKKMSFRKGLIITFVLLISLPLVIITGISYVKITEAMTNQMEQSTASLIQEIEHELTYYFHIFESSSQLIADLPLTASVTESEYNEYSFRSMLTSYVEGYDEVDHIYLGYEDHTFIIAPEVELPDDFDPTQRLWYTSAKEAGEFVWTEPYIDAEDPNAKKLTVSGATPVYNKNTKKFKGVLAVDINLDLLSEKLNAIQVGNSGYPVLLTSDAVVLTHKNKDLIGTIGPVEDLNAFIRANDSGIFEYTYNGEKKMAMLSTMDNLGWKILVTLPKSVLTRDSDALVKLIVFISLILLIIAILIGIIYSNSINKNVKSIVERVEKLKLGDFTPQKLNLNTKEFIMLGDSIENMSENVSGLVASVKMATDKVNLAASDMSSYSNEATASASEVSKAIEEIAEGASHQAQDAEKANLITQKAGASIESLVSNIDIMIDQNKQAMSSNEIGHKAMNMLEQKNVENKLATEETASAINTLEEKSKRIGNFITVISGIADQTNLLSLNASIEAARAGEHGLGFAVVADEIRKLAIESNTAATEISEIVKEIQKESKNAVEIVDRVKLRSEEQNLALGEARVTFEEISSAIIGANQVIDAILVSLNEIKEDMTLTSNAVENIAAVSEEAAAASEEANASMEQQNTVMAELSDLALQLNELTNHLSIELGKFKTQSK